MPKVLIFNAPPEAGKDIAADFCAGRLNLKNYKFATRGIELVKDLYSLSDREWDEMNSRKLKNTPNYKLHGKSPRAALKDMCENKIKPVYGDHYFGHYLAEKIKKEDEDVIISDCGFSCELKEVVDAVGAHNVFLVRINRAGTSFEDDTRMYLRGDKVPAGVTCLDIPNLMPFGKDNDKAYEEFLYSALRLAESWFGERGRA